MWPAAHEIQPTGPDADDPTPIGQSVRRVPASVIWPVRHAVLRPAAPAAEAVFAGDDDPDSGHFAGYQAGELAGSASVYLEDVPAEWAARLTDPAGGTAWRLRGMATTPAARGVGLGAALLRTALSHVTAAGGRLVWCNARTVAAGFYLRAGFTLIGDEYDIPGVGPHLFMTWRTPGS